MSSDSKIPSQSVFSFPTQSEFTFSNFSVSQGSFTAYAAAQQLAGNKTVEFRSLFIHGPENLGKTHLLIAIGNEMAQKFPDKRTFYIDIGLMLSNADDFEIEIANSKIVQLAEADIILFDALDGIGRYPALQKNLYYIYNSLAERGGATVFSARSRPQGLGAEDFLETRFLWGLVAGIQPFDIKSAENVIMKLGKDISLVIPPACAHFLVNRIDRDFLSIKNAVERINEFSFREKRKVTLPLIKEALGL